MTRAAAESLAARVRARPEQYFWLHQRWVKWSYTSRHNS
jgi:lauroyl/myristoyl acyltransferase